MSLYRCSLVIHLSRLLLCHIYLARRLAAGGDDGIRTHDPLLAGQVLSQLSYTPIGVENCLSAVLVLALTYLPAQSPVKYCRHS